jgi:hypothetical protein
MEQCILAFKNPTESLQRLRGQKKPVAPNFICRKILKKSAKNKWSKFIFKYCASTLYKTFVSASHYI